MRPTREAAVRRRGARESNLARCAESWAPCTGSSAPCLRGLRQRTTPAGVKRQHLGDSESSERELRIDDTHSERDERPISCTYLHNPHRPRNRPLRCCRMLPRASVPRAHPSSRAPARSTSGSALCPARTAQVYASFVSFTALTIADVMSIALPHAPLATLSTMTDTRISEPPPSAGEMSKLPTVILFGSTCDLGRGWPTSVVTTTSPAYLTCP
mmetsp:Transcript_10158/g.26539  ORF Transcript_10158/g.26539 Transcript_10158/m.26539 type:complete len:214 (-) Transcript_10158:384-1025(-)